MDRDCDQRSTRSSASRSPQDTWVAASVCEERFRAAWRRTAVPELARHVANLQGENLADVLPALICIDIEERLAINAAVALEDYFHAFPSLAEQPDAMLRVIQAEIRLRRQAGQTVAVDEYQDRFPQFSAALDENAASPDDTSSPAPTSTQSQTLGVDRQPGERVGAFEIVQALGVGGASRVYLARRLTTNETVALKISTVDRGEGRILALLKHPGIVSCLGEEAVDSLHLLVLRYEPGISLADLLERLGDRPRRSLTEADVRSLIKAGCDANAEGTLSRVGEDEKAVELVCSKRLQSAAPACDVETAESRATCFIDSNRKITFRSPKRTRFAEVVCDIVGQLARALDHAHQQGVVHLDVKPENVLLTPAGNAILLDFNIAVCRQPQCSADAVTLGGTLAYMPPEMLRPLAVETNMQPTDVHGTADVYALGVLLFEFLTGRRPFHIAESGGALAISAREMLAERLKGTPKLPADGPQLADGLATILRNCLQPDPAQRYQTAGQLADDLERCLARQPLRHAVEPMTERIRNWFRRQRVVLLMGAVLVLVACVVFVRRDFATEHNRLQRAAELISEAADMDVESDAANLRARLSKTEQLVTAPGVLPHSQLDGQRLQLWNQLGRRWADLEDWPRSLACFQSAIAIDAESATAYENLGVAYVLQGEFAPALRAFDRALELDRDNPAILAKRGAVQIKLGNTPQARDDLQGALALNPSREVAAAVRQLLESLEPPSDQIPR